MRDIRYQAAILSGTRLLLLRCRLRNGVEFWVLPGGGREQAETEAECVAREVREELGVDVTVEGLLYDVPANPPDGTYSRWRTYRCSIVSGEPQPGRESWADLVAIRWLDLDEPHLWEDALRSDTFLFPQLMRIRRALALPDTDIDAVGP